MSRRSHSGPLAALAVAALAVAFLCAAAEGSCLSYGHSCWGAHGKRSGGGGGASPRLGLVPDDARWTVSRLVAAPALWQVAAGDADVDDVGGGVGARGGRRGQAAPGQPLLDEGPEAVEAEGVPEAGGRRQAGAVLLMSGQPPAIDLLQLLSQGAMARAAAE
ncbi:uncharacterized protein LOC126293515 [Schistocerca gregaria]|uniref:uncharacterized protein LOC126293515 n=1 Tax=Schistocerca gregaria TaxID=7010 RepID=UPI00211E568A|nr:uncharacterized protein LOC126293515 [Schistocerca gregaria]